ncbi:MAG: transcription-repair coupling factor [Acidobacteriota bacterium]
MARKRTEAFDPLLDIEELGIPASAEASIEPITLVGLPPGARALALLSLAARRGRPIIVVTTSDASASVLARDMRGLAGLTGAVDPAVISVVPALDADPYDGLTAHLGTVSRRVRALWRASDLETPVTVLPGRALLLPLPPAKRMEPFFLDVREGGCFEQADRAGWFEAAGYRRVDLVSEPGEYSRRGGILDVFTPIRDDPVRIELEGTRVVSLREFRPSDQRSIRRIEQFTMSPARETVIEADEIERLRACLRDNPDGRRLEEMLQTRGEFPGIMACSRLLYPEARGVLDVLRAAGRSEPVIVCDELEMTLEQIRQERAGLLRAGESMQGLPPPEDLMVPADAIEQALGEAPVLFRHLDIEAEDGRRQRRYRSSGMSSYRGRLPDLMSMIGSERRAGRTVWIVMNSEGRANRMGALLRDHGLEAAPWRVGAGEGLYLASAEISVGFILPEVDLTVIVEREIFGIEPRRRKRSVLPAFTSDFRDLDPGDLVVHVDHGVGRYEGLTRLEGDGREIDVMVLSYQGKDKLFIPVTRLDLVQKYSGAGGRPMTLEKLGGTGWTKTKQRVRKAMRDMAAELLNLYAARKTVRGYAASEDTPWQSDFEDSFPYELTSDQQIAIAEIKSDLESPVPMDRLLCGDVGFGKTEVAMRAAFKMVMDGKQVAVLAPTTVLVFQHLQTFRERFSAFPVRIESLSRFRTPREQKSVIAAMAAGAVDILIGTHRLLSKDVRFKDLGLLIVDEEQRFGVAHKERIKNLRKNVDVLTLTATPIPRTLQMSLMGVRDLSIIETPPENRLAIQTHLVPFKEPIIMSAIRHELERDGQVYFVHNRVDSVHAMASLIGKLVPEATIKVAHGQMPERDLEDAMMRFLRGDYRVLVSTTIIENGLDIPRVNTLIVNRADRFGLAQLYQLRGRIGRSDRQAYAYLLVPPERTMTELARKRLKALQEFSELGSGFRIAATDLEIRGAGSLLGPAQHGHIAALGFELYCRMLEHAVEELKRGGAPVPEVKTSLNLSVDLMIPEEFMAGEHHRLMFYKRIASATTREELDRIRDEMEDRFGRLPRQGLNLLAVAELRLLAEKLQVQQFDYRSGQLIAKFSETSPVEPERILRFVSRRSDATFSPPAVLRIRGERRETERLALAREVLTSLA